MYIFFFELARLIGIKKFLQIYSDRSGDFYAGVMSHDLPQIQILEKCTFKQGNDIKGVCVCSVHCISCTINIVNGLYNLSFSSLCAFVV